ncbi:hypothetical protein MBLNU457_6283t1 [Dothideomycetes sp. NU457]
MSADLFAAFGENEVDEKPPNNVNNVNTGLHELSIQPNPHGLVQASNQQGLDDEGFDDFGDFETAGQDQIAPVTTTSVPQKSVAVDNDWDAWTQEQDLPSAPNPGPPEKIKTARPRPRDENVMFDAEDSDEALWDQAGDLEDDNDDFGDFEGTAANLPHASQTSSSATKPSNTMIDLLELDTETSSHSSSGPAPQSRNEAKPTIPRAKPPQTKAPSPKKPAKAVAEKPSKQTEETWDDFETTTPTAATPTTKTTDPLPQDPQIAVPSALLHRLALLHLEPTQRTHRPTTIPPPSVLLPIFSATISTLTTTFLAPLSSLPPSTKTTLLTNPNTTALLRAYSTFTHILSHILAGRKHRWKRDKYLAQSMSIGPSGSRSGMKIAGLDKSELGREDQIAADVLAVWSKQVGRLRNIVGAYNAAVGDKGKIGPVPELGATIPVRVAKGAEGAVVGLQPCALCGLKREERVAKVDAEVEDSFGEWWVEGVNMHTSCAVFWEGWQGELRGR